MSKVCFSLRELSGKISRVLKVSLAGQNRGQSHERRKRKRRMKRGIQTVSDVLDL